MSPRAGLVVLVALAAACGGAPDEARPVDAPVADAARCDGTACAPFACGLDDGTCFRWCTSDAMCAAGFACEDAACVGTQCTPETAAAICGPYACVNGACLTDCALGPCRDGFYCRGDNACVPRCTHRGDPGCGGYLCDLDVGECEAYCLDGELECAAGHACDAGDQCVPDLAAPPCRDGCGPYACLAEVGRCATHCVEDDDCAAGATCVASACT